MNIAATLRQHDIVEEPPIVLCECSRTQETRSEVRPTPLPHPSRLKPSRTHYPLVSVLSPTTMDRHWSHANLYHCFQQQTWPNKELVVLDTGERPSPFFSSLTDPRVRYTHLALPSNVADLITTMLRAAATQPTRGETRGNWLALPLTTRATEESGTSSKMKESSLCSLATSCGT